MTDATSALAGEEASAAARAAADAVPSVSSTAPIITSAAPAAAGAALEVAATALATSSAGPSVGAGTSVQVLHLPAPPASWLVVRQLLVVAALLVAVSWGVVVLALALPLTVGRMLVRQILATQAKRVSDFLPLSLGVVVLSAVILVAVKISEAAPALAARAASLEDRRLGHMLLCMCSVTAMVLIGLVLVPLGLGTLMFRLVLPIKAHSVYQVPIIFMGTDCWSLGLVLTKVIFRLVQTDVGLHGLHLEFRDVWTDVQGSLTNLFFDLRSHVRIWRSLIWPVLELITVHVLLPHTAAHTLLLCIGDEGWEFWRAALVMYCYHVVLAGRTFLLTAPLARGWLTSVRQRIFDAKYLVSTELQNYHELDLQRRPSQPALSAHAHPSPVAVPAPAASSATGA